MRTGYKIVIGWAALSVACAPLLSRHHHHPTPSASLTVSTAVAASSLAPQQPRRQPVPSGPVFTAEGPRFYAAAAVRNARYVVPDPDPARPYQTRLTHAQEGAFRGWVRAHAVPFDPDAHLADYDMRGYWLATGGRWQPGSHFPDTWKTPYDTSFSAESRYARPDCPLHWHGASLVDDSDGEVVFAGTNS